MLKESSSFVQERNKGKKNISKNSTMTQDLDPTSSMNYQYWLYFIAAQKKPDRYWF